MTNLTTGTSNYSDLVTNLVVRRSEEILADSYVFNDGVRHDGMVIGTNGTIVWPAVAQISADTSTLTEGSPPTAEALTLADDTATAGEYGNVVSITNIVMDQGPLNWIQTASERLSDQAAASIDTIVRDIVMAGTSVIYSNGTARSDVSAILTGTSVQQVVRNLRKSNVPRFRDGFYHAIVTADQAYDLFQDTASAGFLEAVRYTDAGARKLLSGELGTYFGVRFAVIGSQSKIFSTAGAASVDVHSGIFYGPDYCGVGDWATLQAYYTPPGGQSDPLHQLAKLGYRVRFGAALLDSNGARYVRLESAVTA